MHSCKMKFAAEEVFHTYILTHTVQTTLTYGYTHLHVTKNPLLLK